MSNRYLLSSILAVSLLGLVACEKEVAPEEIVPQDENLVEITIRAHDVDTKSTFTGTQIGWEMTDKVAIYDGVAKREFSVTAINDGVATLSGLVSAGATDLYAVFPYSAGREVLPSDNNIRVTIPKDQVVSAGKNFDENAFVSAGKVEDGNVAFKNIVSVLKFNIPSGITAVSLKGFDSSIGGDKIAGAATVTYNAGEPASVVSIAEAVNSPTIVLRPSGATFTEGVHYIALIPSTLASGFKVVFANDDNKISIKKNTSSVTFPLNGGNDITAYTTASALTTWLPNPIMTEADLLTFVGSQDSYAGEEAVLGQNITLTSEWAPVDLTGTLDGQGYTISGLNVNATTVGGMFSIQSGAVLKNVTVEGNINLTTTSTNRPVGLVGYLHGTMHRVTNRTSITLTSAAGNCYLGGLAGWVSRGTMTECKNEGNLTIGSTTGQGFAGGVVGVIYPDGLIQDCVNTGTVTSTASSTGGLGGVIGVQEGGVTQNCVNRGAVVANDMRSNGGAGGVVGALYNNSESVTSVMQCVNEGVITISTNNLMSAGGIVGALSDGAGTTPSAAEVLECTNKSNISVSIAKSAKNSGLDGFYLGGIVGAINAANTSTLLNKIKDCQNVGALSVTTTGTNNDVKIGGIAGNTRGTAVIEGNENAATASLSLVSSAAKSLLCAVGGIVGESGDPWNNETTSFTLTGNINRAAVSSKTNVTENPAGGLIGYCFGPVESSNNMNFGNVERAAADDSSPATGSCFAGGLVGFMAVGGSTDAHAYFTSDKTFGDISSYGRAGLLFGGLRSSSYAGFKFSECVVAGHIISGHTSYDLDITADNYWSRSSSREDAYVWGFLPAGRYNFNAGLSVSYGDAATYDTSSSIPAWTTGMMDIHHISTGRGNCTFIILPDGTTMMVDAGDNGPETDGKLPRVPDDTKTPAEWIVRYVTHFLDEASLPHKLDYFLITHFDNDHMGAPVATYPVGRGRRYYMTGVSYIGNYLDIDNLVDRGYPDYDFPYTGYFDRGSEGIIMNNYKEFILDDYNRVGTMSAFVPGVSNQFVLKNNPGDYSGFEVRNVYGNGQVWTGSGSATSDIVPASATQSELSIENLWSSVIHINYGDFDYHTGGDILGSFGDWRNIESEVASVIGETDVFLCDHHGNDDAMNNAIIAATKPQSFIIPAWSDSQPGSAALARMHDTSLYSGNRTVFAAGHVAANPQIEASGHVVVRVYNGGDQFQVFVLDDTSTDYEIIHQTSIMDSNE